MPVCYRGTRKNRQQSHARRKKRWQRNGNHMPCRQNTCRCVVDKTRAVGASYRQAAVCGGSPPGPAPSLCATSHDGAVRGPLAAAELEVHGVPLHEPLAAQGRGVAQRQEGLGLKTCRTKESICDRVYVVQNVAETRKQLLKMGAVPAAGPAAGQTRAAAARRRSRSGSRTPSPAGRTPGRSPAVLGPCPDGRPADGPRLSLIHI